MQKILVSLAVLARPAAALKCDSPCYDDGELYCTFSSALCEAAEKLSDAALEVPHLINLTQLAHNSPQVLLDEIRASPFRGVVQETPEQEFEPPAMASALPTVTAHGMGDSCWEPGFSGITKDIAKKTGSYATCIPTGGNIITDTIYGFLMSMDKSVDIFAKKIMADPKLAGGFNAIGFSQGNSLIRGYVEKYNNPPVKNWISVHGTVMGVAAFPSCFQQEKPLGLICKVFAEVLGDLAYLNLAQNILFQAGYYRAPTRVASKAYLTNSQIGRLNNENPDIANKTFNANFGTIEKMAMVRALTDSMVYPNEGEQWGALPDGNYAKTALTMKETKFYQQDLFGLKEADAAGKIFNEQTKGDHLEFTAAELYGWVEKYFMSASSTVVV